jgi:hypothetical protein
MIEGLIAAVLPVEALLFHETQRDAGDGRNNRCSGDGCRDLRRSHGPKILGEQDNERPKQRLTPGTITQSRL